MSLKPNQSAANGLKMNLRQDLAQALKNGAGMEMRHILKEAQATGVPREDALAVLNDLYEVAHRDGDETAEDAIVDFRDILHWYCHPSNYIWPRE